MGISMSGASGIDTASIIDQLVSLEQQKITRVESSRSTTQKQIDAYTNLEARLKDITSKAGFLDERTDFNHFNTEVSDEEAVSISTTDEAGEGSYGVKVYQLAAREKLISTDRLIQDADTTALTSLGITGGTFKINGYDITLEDGDTLKYLQDKINNYEVVDVDGDPVLDEDGNRKELGVSATIMQTDTGNFRLVLTADDSGAEGATYADGGSDVLSKLGFVDAKDSMTKQSYTVAGMMGQGQLLNSVASPITIKGTDINGEAVEATYANSLGLTGDALEDDFLSFVEDTFRMGVTAAFDNNGKLTVEDKTAGASKFSLTEVSGVKKNGGVPESLTVNTTETGEKGRNVLSAGRDAVYSIDNINMTSSSNKIDEAVSGVTFELKKVSHETTTNVSISRNYDDVTKQVSNLLSSFNTVLSYINQQTSYQASDVEGEAPTKGALFGDSTLRSMLSGLRGVFHGDYDSGKDTLHALSQIGVETNDKTGEFQLDEEAFKKALEEDYDAVVSMFVTEGRSNNPDVEFGRASSDTKEGTYTVEFGKDGTGHETITFKDKDGNSIGNGTRSGDIVSFDGDGPAKGLMITAPKDKVADQDVTITYSKGLSGRLEEMVETLTDREEGITTMRKESMQERIGRYGDQIIQLNTRLEAYRDRLIKQFTAMEQMMVSLQSQQSAMISQLGQQ